MWFTLANLEHTWLFKNQHALIYTFWARYLHWDIGPIVRSMLSTNITFPARKRYVVLPGYSSEPFFNLFTTNSGFINSTRSVSLLTKPIVYSILQPQTYENEHNFSIVMHLNIQCAKRTSNALHTGMYICIERTVRCTGWANTHDDELVYHT